MRILCFTACMALLLHSVAIHADDRKPPYEAFVEAEDGENVWSGPGGKHYPTQKLRKGDRVQVRRHDPGGWCMISPPDGSFSWVRAEYVKRDGNRGSLTSNHVFVHTGSTLNSEDFTTIQSDLSKGDAVEILGEKNFSFEGGSHLMLKISPIRGETRWIRRQSIVAVDAMRSDPYPDDGFNVRKRTGPIATSESEGMTRPVSSGTLIQDERVDVEAEVSGVRRTNEGTEQPGKQRLAAIDQQFREMIQQEPPTWDLNSLAQQYKQLDDDIGTQSMSTTIGLRMDAVKRYRKIHQDYVDLYRLTSERKKRDAELMGRQTQIDATVDQRTAMASLEPQPMPQPSSLAASRAAPPAFDGAGVVQKMAKTFSGGPQFVLVTPEGRLLTYLQPAPGVDLNPYVGRSMGIVGRRQHRDDWNADTLTVQSLQPVQLRGTR